MLHSAASSCFSKPVLKTKHLLALFGNFASYQPTDVSVSLSKASP